MKKKKKEGEIQEGIQEEIQEKIQESFHFERIDPPPDFVDEYPNINHEPDQRINL